MPDEDPEIQATAPTEPPPAGVRTMSIVRWVILALSVLIAAGSWYAYASSGSRGAAHELYQCPMHPEIVANRPGECPICHMDLERVSGDRTGAAAASASATPSPAAPPESPAKTGQYTCPMHPEVVSDHPGRCPKCKMDLEQVEVKGAGAHSQHEAPDGVVEVGFSLDRVQAIGVRTAKVEARATSVAVRAPAIVEAPEQSTAQVHVRAAGFVEHVAVDQTGVKVKAGQQLFSIYSPEIYQAQSELLATQEWPGLDRDREPLDLGARRKLELLGISGKTADQVVAEKRLLRNTGVSAPIGGYVTRKNVVLGSFVTPEMTLYEIVDLSKVYVVADLFQTAAGSVTVGTQGRFRSRTRPAPIEATVDLVYPQVNVLARTTRVRMTLKNTELSLLPGEYGIVEFGTQAGHAVVIPTDALIDTGNERYVFVEERPGHYAPRRVDVAGEVDGGFELLSGVDPGDTVVSGAAFLIDSESRLRASIARNTVAAARPTEGGAGAPRPSREHAGH